MDATPLPPLRPELRLADAGHGGAEAWRIDDPVRQRSFQLAPGDAELLALWPMRRVISVRDAWLALNRHATAADFAARLQGLLEFLRQHQLLLVAPGSDARELGERANRAARVGIGTWLQRWMGWQLPLLRPQAFLDATLPFVRGLWTLPARLLWAAATLLGLYLVSRQWDAFVGTFGDFAQPAGWLTYAVALLALKIVHELGHAYAAAHHGVAVPTMGLSVAYGVPMLYTDTSDATRLPQRAGRLWIGGAGMLAESLVAGLCTLGWALLPDGPGRAVCFVVATSSWITTLAVNLNPLGRFDGYHMLADLLRFPNLQQRGLAHAAAALERLLFGQSQEMPEPLRGWRSAALAAYGVGVWLFRVSIGLGAAALVYDQLFQLAGLMLAAATLWWTVASPLGPRLAGWWRRRRGVSARRWVGLAGVLALLGGLVGAPLDRSVDAAATLGWQEEQLLYAPEVAEVTEVLARDGDAVARGQPLFVLRSPELQRRIAEAETQRVLMRERIDRIAADAQDRSELLVLEQQQAEADAAVLGLRQRVGQLALRAEADGRVVDLPPALAPGRWVRSDQPLARLLVGPTRDVLAYVDDGSLRRLQAGARAEFRADDLTLPPVALKLIAIDPAAAEQVTPDLLASAHGGPVPTVLDRHGRAVPRQTLHRVRFELQPGHATAGHRLLLRGQVRIDAAPESLLQQAARRLVRIVLRELQS